MNKTVHSQVQDDGVLFQNEKCCIKYDEEGKVRIEELSAEDLIKVASVSTIVTDLNNIPFSKEMRKLYGNDIKNIYQMALNNQDKNAIEYAMKLKKTMERHILLQRKIEYVVPAGVSFIGIMILAYLEFVLWQRDIFYILIFSSLGGLISLIIQQNKIEIEYNVQTYMIVVESIKRVVLTLSMGTVGYIGIKSEILFANLDIMQNKYVLFLIIIACAYSSTFIPNMLDVLIQKDIKSMESDE